MGSLLKLIAQSDDCIDAGPDAFAVMELTTLLELLGAARLAS